ncbi:uncharacterized protein LOC129618824 [Condylostylus longicornis]|uniref:uncharacterized protein LOC129618824 n=1 Tax=Condylostylus longicornis TaxID=2530218 RepID=UPI00244DAD1B|nr:uncharacterized protein LOC129618824 [Condylostylus longicornis]
MGSTVITFDKEFAPRRLRNWEVPKVFPKRPLQRYGKTKIISDENGHLLPHIPRPKTSPWGNFKSTWQLPDKLSQKQIEDMNSSLTNKNKWATRNKKPDTKYSEHPKSRKIKKAKSLDLEYVPGDFTEPKDQHPSRELLLEQKELRDQGQLPKLDKPDEFFLEKHQCNDKVALLATKEKEKRSPSPHVLGKDIDPTDVHQLRQALGETNITTDDLDKMRYLSVKPIPEKPNYRTPSPIIPAKYNFQIARKMHAENLEHQPLPDRITDEQFKKLEAQGYNFPGFALDFVPKPTAVGVGAYNVGPTHCTKMKIYRPQTCGVVPKPLSRYNKQYINVHRPGTSVVDKKMGQMDLAICWDFRPADSNDEPKWTRHIDGTEDDAGPAVFQIVTTPRSPKPNETGRSGGVFTSTFGDPGFFDKDIIKKKSNFGGEKTDLKCTCGTSPVVFPEEMQQAVAQSENNNFRSKSASRGDILVDNTKLFKSSPNLSEFQVSEYAPQYYKENMHKLNDNNNNDEDFEIKEYKPKVQSYGKVLHSCNKYRGKPKEVRAKQPSFLKKTMRLCYKVAPQPYPEESEKAEYKKAFKAGAPKRDVTGGISSDSGCSTMSSCSTGTKILVVPKPRNPYMRKKYDISTLVPPFKSYKGGAGQGGYPEHWRLASVYQHSYKPIEQRKCMFMDTIFK